MSRNTRSDLFCSLLHLREAFIFLEVQFFWTSNKKVTKCFLKNWTSKFFLDVLHVFLDVHKKKSGRLKICFLTCIFWRKIGCPIFLRPKMDAQQKRGRPTKKNGHPKNGRPAKIVDVTFFGRPKKLGVQKKRYGRPTFWTPKNNRLPNTNWTSKKKIKR